MSLGSSGTMRATNSDADRPFQFAVPVGRRFGDNRAVARLNLVRHCVVRPDQLDALVRFHFKVATFSKRRAEEQNGGDQHKKSDRRDEYPLPGETSAILPVVSLRLQHILIPSLGLFGHRADRNSRVFERRRDAAALRSLKPRFCLNETKRSPGGAAPRMQQRLYGSAIAPSAGTSVTAGARPGTDFIARAARLGLSPPTDSTLFISRILNRTRRTTKATRTSPGHLCIVESGSLAQRASEKRERTVHAVRKNRERNVKKAGPLDA